MQSVTFKELCFEITRFTCSSGCTEKPDNTVPTPRRRELLDKEEIRKGFPEGTLRSVLFTECLKCTHIVP